MQLPPTIISIDKEKKDKAKKKSSKASKETTAKSSSASKSSKLSKTEKEPPQSSDSVDELEVSGDEMMKGDPPTANKAVLQPPRSLETTLFDRLEQMYGSRLKRMLEIQYR